MFVAGGTGYMGKSLIVELVRAGYEVSAVVRPGKEETLPSRCQIVVGDVLDGSSYAERVRGRDTFVHLVGVPHPSPKKAPLFRSVDLKSLHEAVTVASETGVEHFVYVSVAHPAPVMKAYIEVRSECEAIIRAAKLNATILRPWYVLGPGHRWPYFLLPMYWLFEHFPGSRDTARRLGLVTLKQMIATLRWSVENPCRGVRVLEVSQIRESRF